MQWSLYLWVGCEVGAELAIRRKRTLMRCRQSFRTGIPCRRNTSRGAGGLVGSDWVRSVVYVLAVGRVVRGIVIKINKRKTKK